MVENRPKEFGNVDWPDGWFVFERGIVKGPFTTEETFSGKTKDKDASSFMVSRKGFGRWYALNDLASVYHQADRIGVANTASVKDIETTLSEEISKLAKIEDEIALQRREAIKELEETASDTVSGALGPNRGPVQAKKAASLVSVSVGQSPAEQASVSPTPTSDELSLAPATRGRATLESRRKNASNEVRQSASFASIDQPMQTARRSKKEEDRSLAYNHLVLAGRLRLGALSNPWIEAGAKFFAALGIYWGLWYRRSLVAVIFHIDGSIVPKNARYVWKALIPGYHMVLTRRLATAVATMERQNGYQTVSPTKAMWLAVLPPLAIIYLQSALNRHWKLHVKHESGK